MEKEYGNMHRSLRLCRFWTIFPPYSAFAGGKRRGKYGVKYEGTIVGVGNTLVWQYCQLYCHLPTNTYLASLWSSPSLCKWLGL